MRYTYTDEDIEFLRKYYPIGNWDEIFKRFPTLSKTAIYKKCYKHGIKYDDSHRAKFDNTKSRIYWTDEEIKLLIDNYAILKMDDLLKLFPNRTKNMLVCKAKILGLKSFARQKQIWKQEELDYIVENLELVPDKIMADKLHRSFRSVKAKREELGLFRQDRGSCSYPTLSKYLRGQNYQWKKDSMNYCDYKCVLTGSKDFQIHHLYSVSSIIDDILNKYPKFRDISFNYYSEEDLSFLLSKFLEEQAKYPLGECVDKKLHTLFHSMYGQYYNTPQQWYSFKNDYNNGIYKKYV